MRKSIRLQSSFYLPFNATGSQQQMLLLMSVLKALPAAPVILSTFQQSLLQLDSRFRFSRIKDMCLTFFGMLKEMEMIKDHKGFIQHGKEKAFQRHKLLYLNL